MTNFQLKVRRFEQTCVFELFWGKGQQLSATLAYPESLSVFYQEWQRVYISYYKSELRGWIEASGSVVTPPIDWHAKLVQAEAKLLSEFHHWLRSAELFEIRAAIANRLLANNQQQITNNRQLTTNVFLTCYSTELERLPWEAWEIGAEFPMFGRIRIARTPVNIHQETVSRQQRRGKKARVLVILGDDTGLNLQGDQMAVRSLSRLVEVQFVGWHPGQEIAELKATISAVIADGRGWDVLVFAGHSNETAMTGGELAIAPNASMSISEITPQLLLAKQRGLQFALFNSCSGLSLATSLIDLGLSQVAMMREPIHNAVAQVFLVKFLQGLAEYKDVQDSLLSACQYLKVEKNLTYPSAYLIPSLFCHPDAVPFRIQRSGVKITLNRMLPTRTEAIAISALTLLSLSLPVQDFLLEKRLLTQAVYRQLTEQVPAAVPPPVLLVQIDEKSIREAKIADPKPMNRKYLARLVDNLSARDARVIGIDYLLDRPQGENDQILARSLQATVQHSPFPSWLVFASVRDDGEGWLKVLPEIANPSWSLQGHIHLSHWYISLLPQANSASQTLPFAYLLALAYRLNVEATPPIPQSLEDVHPINSQLSSQTDFFSGVADYLRREKGQDYKTLFSSRAQLQPITSFSYDLGQMWLHPIIDFSIPPERAYQRIPAWQLLDSTADSPQRHLKEQVVIIAPGGYGEAGVFKDGQDNFPLPAALDCWFNHSDSQVSRSRFTAGEAHAYIIHHLLNQRLVVPIPDLWLIGLGVLLGKGITLVEMGNRVSLQRRVKWGILLSGTAVYGLVSLQIYISGAVLLPLIFPVVTLWTYAIPPLLQKNQNG